VAQSLAKKPPATAANILMRMNKDKCVKVLKEWSHGVRTIIMNEMGDRAVPLLGSIKYEDRSRLLISLNSNVVKKYSKEISSEDLEGMMDYWTQEDLKVVLMRLSPNVGAKLVSMLEEEDIVGVVHDLKPWVQASLMDKLDDSLRARVLEKMDFSAAIDLFTRWNLIHRRAVLEHLSIKRRQELLQVIGPKNVAEILEKLDPQRIKENLSLLDVERQRDAFYRFGKDIQHDLFPEMPDNLQVRILNGMDPLDAIKLLDLVPEEHSDMLIKALDDDQASAIRMATLMR
jgi:Mg/Co/Ni transporter MgtE